MFHKTGDDLSGRALHTVEAISETPEGTSIRLNAALQQRGGHAHGEDTAVESLRETGAGGGGVRSTSLLGLLHWLWEEAGLNLWHPRWHRSWSTCRNRLLQHAADCVVNGLELTGRLYIIPPYRPVDAEANAADFAVFCKKLTRPGRHGARRLARPYDRQRGLVIGEIKNVAATTYGAQFMLRHHRWPLYANAGLAGRVRRSYRHAFSAAAEAAAESGDARRIGLFLVERTVSNNLAIVDMAAMLTNRMWIPADSYHEVVMADHITGAGHSFTKPVRYDLTEAVFPDFAITTTGNPVFVEVYGVQGRADYDQRRRDKRAYYRAAGLSVIEWDVAEVMPHLPPSPFPRRSAGW